MIDSETLQLYANQADAQGETTWADAMFRACDTIDAQAAEIERLRRALHVLERNAPNAIEDEKTFLLTWDGRRYNEIRQEWGYHPLYELLGPCSVEQANGRAAELAGILGDARLVTGASVPAETTRAVEDGYGRWTLYKDDTKIGLVDTLVTSLAGAPAIYDVEPEDEHRSPEHRRLYDE